MAQQMNGAQRKTVWIKALSVLAAVVIAGIGAWAAAHQAASGNQNTCQGRAVCGDDNDGNNLGGGNNADRTDSGTRK
ncbi:hypothetical protein [Streptomyces fagopyri]|uniref:hypothetical protein n=1 Tax=Streptomyces fagopyri TaxID=2662397 RepID=UPI003713FDB3